MNKKGDILFGKVIHVCSEGITVLTNKKYVFEIPKKFVTDWTGKNLYSDFKLRDRINFYVEEIDNTNKTGIGNFKINHSYYARSPYAEELRETKHGFTKLKESIKREITSWEQNNRGC
ncbi:30S ribosomal protein S1 [Mycoplasmopsis californica HAZ160_1]|uniref:Uncharacterized protein n=2 Tax=Mycoplasmopsis californica TaxID=2113 RepID=A0A059XLL1_9BACT|nr:hypothetical protein [Mycoplasmopsis californica]AIA29419.1 hypothetical protein MCFN_01375 [Mycoplasmopsis californica]BAP01132.1 30S ribosomal protein S1 [Mycoplasmopsis californica HAZ160_1]BBG40998.1 30S ribosomal protein S1 [Mycoplasmopsis californica]BBG41591.1 30S ribosomal protein S1 [Mycoplasmopsis californica]BBG42185.1 30S ribosomal protein S1 [Mycoplasmopsis californica]